MPRLHGFCVTLVGYIILLEVSVPYNGDNMPKSQGYCEVTVEIVPGSMLCQLQRFEKSEVVILISLFT